MKKLVFLFPLLLSIIRLHTLGVFDQPLIGIFGSDFYTAAAVGQFLLKHPFFFPERLPEFFFPEGELTASFPEFLSEPVWQILYKFTLWIRPDPIWALWLGMTLTSLFNIWGTFWILYRRFSGRSVVGVLLGWATIAMSPWIWSRNLGQWPLGWSPIFLFCILLWFDLFLGKKPMRPWVAILAHLLLLGQSIYYSVFLILLVFAWGMSQIHKLAEQPWRKQLLFAVLFAITGYGLMAGFSAVRFQAARSLGVTLSQTDRPIEQLHIYSIRMREMSKGGPGSLWNDWLKPKHPARDEEGFPAPLPKLLVAFTILALIFSRRSTSSSERSDWRAPTLLVTIGVAWFLICGLQEIPFVRERVLHRIFPFIRAYARIMMPLTCLIGIWIAAVWPKELKWKGSSLAASAPLLVTGIFLLAADYGWPQGAFAMTNTLPPCQERFDQVKVEGLPIFLHQAVHFNSLHCNASEWIFFAKTGLPLVTRPWIKPIEPLVKDSAACLEWKPRVDRALQSVGKILWWYEGSRLGWKQSQECLGDTSAQIIFEEPGLIVSRLISTSAQEKK